MVEEENSGCPQAAHTNVPARFSAFSGLVNARSVPCFRRTLYYSGESVWCHCSSVFVTGKVSSLIEMLEARGRAIQPSTGALPSAAPAANRNCLRLDIILG